MMAWVSGSAFQRAAALQNQVGPHAADRELLHPSVVLGAIGVGVEVTRAGVADILQELHQEERRLRVGRAEAEVLVVAAERLVVQVDVKQLAGLPRLRHRVREVEARHLLVGHFGVHADHLGVIQRRNKAR